MSAPIVAFRAIEKVRTIYEMLAECTHNGFPVLDNRKWVVGIISRNHLITVIQQQWFENTVIENMSIRKGNTHLMR
jgi:CBS-domain-containing membrane protein